MEFTIYEEYPTDKNLKKLNLIDFPITLILASKSLREFEKLENKVKKLNSNIKEIGYWPVLKKEEGYWFSALSGSKGLKRIFNELRGRKTSKPLLLNLDAEIPHQTPSLMIKNLPYILKNKKIMSNFLKEHKKFNINILITEISNNTRNFPIDFLFSNLTLKFFGITYNPIKYKIKGVVKIGYTSFCKYDGLINNFIFGKPNPERFRFLVRKEKEKYKEKFGIVVGTIAIGEMGNEPILTPKELYRDLKILKEEKVNNVYLFRLGGLNREYVKVLKEFTKPQIT